MGFFLSGDGLAHPSELTSRVTFVVCVVPNFSNRARFQKRDAVQIVFSLYFYSFIFYLFDRSARTVATHSVHTFNVSLVNAQRGPGSG
jgi:hypothetical protein